MILYQVILKKKTRASFLNLHSETEVKRHKKDTKTTKPLIPNKIGVG
jgi:hypothetical protein